MGDLAGLVERASSLRERLARKDFEPVQGGATGIETRLKRWRQVVAKGDERIFRRRLEWAGWNIETLRPALGAVRLADPSSLPEWAHTLAAVMQAAAPLSVDSSSKTDRCFDPKAPLAFEDVFIPFLQVARQKLTDQTGSRYTLLSTEAHASLERALLSRLSRLCSRPLMLEFSIFRSIGHDVRADSARSDRQSYDAFVQQLLRDGLDAFFQEYAVLGRLAATAMEDWVAAAAEFVQRLAADRAEIQSTFLGGADLGQVTAIQAELSDYHHHGRSVFVLTFASGSKLVYKPKDAGLEAAFSELIEWLNRQEEFTPLRVVRVMNRADYGWVEYIEHLPAADRAAAQRYYTRAGMLLCLLYVLGGTDTHNENLIANGEYPVLVDVEALLHPRARDMLDSPDQAGSMDALYQQLGESVLASGLLTEWNVSRNGRSVFDMSGLGNIGDAQVAFQRQTWKDINTDDMRLDEETFYMPPEANTLLLNGEVVSPNDYAAELVEGFQRMYRLLLDQRELLLQPDSPLALLARQPVRFIFRNTAIYAAVHNKALNPKYLRNGADRSIELDALSRAYLIGENRPYNWSLLSAELEAMERLDVPLFTARCDGDAVMAGDQEIVPNAFKEPSYERARMHLQKLGESDLAFQVALIRGSLYTRVARSSSVSTGNSPAGEQITSDHLAPLSRDEYVRQAALIGQDLARRAIRLADGSISWIAVCHDDALDRFRLQPLSWDLYEGASGVALFLAALAEITREAQYRDLAYSTLQPMRKMIQNPNHPASRRMFKRMLIGGAVGFGSLIYALARIGALLDDDTLVDNAVQLAQQITDDHIAADRNLDVIGGAAGAILGLLALYQAGPDPGVLQRAIACGEHLVSHRVTSPSGFHTWSTMDSLLTGFSHGAAGMAYSLLRLHSATHTPIFLQAAQEAIAYERSVFSPEAGNWPDLRQPRPADGEPRFMTSWCHGAPGITLARLGGLPVLDAPEIRQDIEVGLAATQNLGLTEVDHLCCGNLGRVETLLVAAQRLNFPELDSEARKRATWIVNRAMCAGAFGLSSDLPPEVARIGFFQGTSGIGYELLRLANPQALPSVLLWE